MAGSDVATAIEFTRIDAGDPVDDGGISWGAAWGDFDGDGDADLFVANAGPAFANDPTPTDDFLYVNEGDGTFRRTFAGPVVNDGAGCAGGSSASGVWGDCDNDGDLDLFVATSGCEFPGQTDLLYQNDGAGGFTSITAGSVVETLGMSQSSAWADYDSDGDLDLFVTDWQDGRNLLYRNLGDGIFERVDRGVLVEEGGESFGCAWGDYDSDGDPDLFVANFLNREGVAAEARDNFLYENLGEGEFAKVVEGDVVNDGGNSWGAAWGDYDGDGDLDLFVANAFGEQNFLYSNEGDGIFERVMDAPIATDVGDSSAPIWADFDNDGHLDLFVTNYQRPHFLYRNRGDGTFERILEGSLVEGSAGAASAAAADYDGDGFMDLFMANQGTFTSEDNALYRNDGNANAWIHITCAGTISNRSAIGARVRVKAVIGGVERWQMREISGGGGSTNQNDLRVHFGLGDATVIDTLRVEWPSGEAQELHGVAVRQFLTVVETPPVAPGRFRRGDCNDSGTVDIADAVCIFNWLFAGGTAPGCIAATNTNGDARVNIADATYLLNHLFVGGPEPVAPYPECGDGIMPLDAHTCETALRSCM